MFNNKTTRSIILFKANYTNDKNNLHLQFWNISSLIWTKINHFFTIKNHILSLTLEKSG